MTIITSVHDMQAWSDAQRSLGKRIGFVPTMGALHSGHQSLIRTAQQECDSVVTSVFVNPTQFAEGEDFTKYPRQLQSDIELIEAAGGTVLFAPTVDQMYPAGSSCAIEPGELARKFEGAFRPTHFSGVATIVAKLLNAVKPHEAYFGQKDYQQTLVVKQLVRDLCFDTDVRVLPTIRESTGLAKSSRNVYLSPSDRENATTLWRALDAAHAAISEGQTNRVAVNSMMLQVLESSGELKIDYVAAANASDLTEPDNFMPGDSVVCLLAVRLGTTRLIDNAVFEIPAE